MACLLGGNQSECALNSPFSLGTPFPSLSRMSIRFPMDKGGVTIFAHRRSLSSWKEQTRVPSTTYFSSDSSLIFPLLANNKLELKVYQIVGCNRIWFHLSTYFFLFCPISKGRKREIHKFETHVMFSSLATYCVLVELGSPNVTTVNRRLST